MQQLQDQISFWLTSLATTDIILLAVLGLATASVLFVPSQLVIALLEIAGHKMSIFLAPFHRLSGALLGVKSGPYDVKTALNYDDDDDDFGRDSGDSSGIDDNSPSAGWAASQRLQQKLASMQNVNPESYHVPGLWNAGGNTCFLNSTLQAMASLDAFHPFLKSIVDLAATFEETAPVSEALLDLFDALNTPCSSRKVYKPMAVAQALSASSPSRRRMLNSDQQDAQEFYLALLAAVTEELDRFQRLANESLTSLGIGSVLDKEVRPYHIIDFDEKSNLNECFEKFEDEQETIIRNPVQSLHAHRIACTTCGYSEATRHLPSDYLGLNAPYTASCDLDDMLEDFSKLEVLDEYGCRRCAVKATVARLQRSLDVSRSGVGSETTPSKRKRMRETQKHINRLKTCLEEDDTEREFAEPKLERILSPATKQSMFSRPADALVIHISRSTTYSRGGMPLKNTCSVAFPATLDLTAFCTTSRIRTIQQSALPTRMPLTILESPIATDDAEDQQDRVLYRLCSLVVHFGLHNYGHYITYRAHRIRDKTHWFRISDETVTQSSQEEVLAANPFLLFYERIESQANLKNGDIVGRTFSRMHSPSV